MEWRKGPTIGRGSSAVVSVATTAAGEVFAVKSAGVSSSGSLRKEEIIMTQFSSPFVVQCFGSDVKDHVFNLFLEYVPGGTLSDLIRSSGGGRLEEAAIRLYARQLVEGLNCVHLKGVAHCDIKGQNILVGAGGLKIADFGCAKWVGGKLGGSFAGTPAYMAPEVARGEEQGFPADVWALGCTVIEMATGTIPWPEMKDPAAALYRVAYSGDVPEFPDWFSDAGRDFLGKCLVREAAERWTAAELLQHPFISSVDSDSGEIRELVRNSPTSVMDQCFWDAMEVSDFSLDPTGTASSSTNSPAARITGLAGGVLPMNLNFPDWTEEEDWVTVRDDGNKESSRDYYSSEDSNYENLIGEEETGVLTAIEDPFLNSFSDEINVTDRIRDFSSGLSVSRTIMSDQTVMEFKSTFPAIFTVLFSWHYSIGEEDD
ncbi:mitogen-activated protein kinase kinase kinase 18-like [Andrographis paniculata]|uniref:mitogen-activated protein kinase kinase kinase 18-like n=1 Tax=Andrographis paniculata TaxID=175694 RepID=UPI0021E7D874|nr:mitogen-activated protein kinase kinase kinase 18-like [Andrographis paniculata]